MKQKRPSRGSLDVLFAHSGQLENYSDDLIWRLDRVGSYTDDILKLVDDYGEAFTRELNANDLRRLGRLVNEGLSDDVVDAVIKHVDYFAGYSDDAIKKIAESGCNAERILTQMDNYAKDFTEDLTAGQLKRLDDILEQGITQEQFEVLINHGKQLDDYTDEVIGLWRDYAGNGDDFLNLVDEFGDEFVEAFKENREAAVNWFKDGIGVELRNGYRFGRLSVDSAEIQATAIQAAGGKAAAVSSLDTSRFRNVNDVRSFLESIPEDATNLPWEPSANIPDGTDRFVWTDQNGNKWFAECHGPDSMATIGSNAQTGWVYRISVRINGQGKPFYMASDGKFYSSKMFNDASSYYVESIINDTHIPIN